jgi:signal transduction histidine kinase
VPGASALGLPVVTGLLAGAAGVYVLGSIAVLDPAEAPPTTYASSLIGAWFVVGSGVGVIAVGVATRAARPTTPTGLWALLLGVSWLAPIWLGWSEGSAGVHSVARLAVPFVLPCLCQVLLGGNDSSYLVRTATRAAWIAAVLVAAGLAVLRNPLYDLRCWTGCSGDNLFLVRSDPGLARSLTTAWLWVTLVIASTVSGLLAWKLFVASPVRRSREWPIVLPGIGFLLALVAHASALLLLSDTLTREPVESSHLPLVATYRLGALALCALAAGLGWNILREHRRKRAVITLAQDLGASPPPGALRRVLARSLGDDTLEVGYWLPDTTRWVDSRGHALAGQPAGRATMTVLRAGEPVAKVTFDPVAADVGEIEDLIGSAARLAIDNERLRAQSLARLEDVRASRVRIVAAADAARRDLELDLHDGAQQRLLAVSHELRLARTDAFEPHLVEALGAAIEDTRESLANLREIAHGIFPAVLTEAGLAAALKTLADGAPVPVEIVEVPDGRLSAQVERTAYLIVDRSVAASARSGAGLAVTVRDVGGSIKVEVSGAFGEDDVYLRDRVEAAGGELTCAELRRVAEIPH